MHELSRPGRRAFAAVLLAGSMIAPGGQAQASTAAQTGEPAQSSQAAAATKSTCIYLVKDISRANGIYLGGVAVLRKSGATVKGEIGQLYSEWASFSGVVAGRKLTGTLDGSPVTWTWVRSDSRIKGWKRVSRARLLKYSAGHVPLKGGTCSSVTVSLTAAGGSLVVDVDPNRRSSNWRFSVQRYASSRWTTVLRSKTRGRADTRVLDVPPGRYRVIVDPRFGWQGATSAAVDVTA
ncbi:MAG: hypothetical protein WCF04_10210 [Candidatus Nanopelagicales bacterium]